MENSTANDAAYTDPTPEQRSDLTESLWAHVWAMAEHISVRKPSDLPAAGWREKPLALQWQALPDANLSALRILREVAGTVDGMAAEAANRAGRGGATYPQLGTAWGITRQAARNRWPDAVKTSSRSARTELQLAGGTAAVSYLPDDGGWWWIGTGADGVSAEAERTYDTETEAAAHAGMFLACHRAKSYVITCPVCGSTETEEYGEPIRDTDDFADCARCRNCSTSWALDPGADAACTVCGGSGTPGAGPAGRKVEGKWVHSPNCECVGRE